MTMSHTPNPSQRQIQFRWWFRFGFKSKECLCFE